MSIRYLEVSIVTNDDPAPDAFLAACPSRHVMARLGEKWTMLALVALENGSVRFGELHRKIEGVSQKMLTQTLRNLEQDGMVTREVFNEMPLRVEYALTPLGSGVLPLIKAIKRWSEEHLEEILAHRKNSEAT
ncbi:MAG: helix-turn-helix domain-containing protein [Pseudomonadota bacterium]